MRGIASNLARLQSEYISGTCVCHGTESTGFMVIHGGEVRDADVPAAQSPSPGAANNSWVLRCRHPAPCFVMFQHCAWGKGLAALLLVLGIHRGVVLTLAVCRCRLALTPFLTHTGSNRSAASSCSSTSSPSNFITTPAIGKRHLFSFSSLSLVCHVPSHSFELAHSKRQSLPTALLSYRSFVQ